MRTLWQDLRYGLRMLAKRPGFTAVAVLSLALGIGINTATFSVADAVMFRPLPVEAPEQLVTLFTRRPTGRNSGFSYPDYVDYRDRNEVFSDLIAWDSLPLNLSTGSETERARGQIVTGNYFTALGIRAAQGRTLLPEDDRTPGAHPVAVVSYRFWQQRFAADPGAVGRTITLNNQQYTIIGVAPEGFTGAARGGAPDIWVPMMMQEQARPGNNLLTRRGSRWLLLMGRLQPGVTREQAQERLGVLAGELAEANPNLTEREIALAPGARGNTSNVTNLEFPLQILLAVVGLILLIACANVANLLLARASARRREISIRLALGASRARLIRQLLTESLLLALIGGAAGLVIALWTTDLFTGFVPSGLDIRLDARVLGFTLVVSLITGALAGLAPALSASRPDLIPALKDETAALQQGGRRWSLRSLLVVAQIALSLIVLIGAGLFVRSLQNLRGVDPGFAPERVFVMSFDLSLNGYDRNRGRAFYDELLERVAQQPGVESASLARVVRLNLGGSRTDVVIDGYTPQPNEGLHLDYNIISPQYFQTMSIPLVRGRDFTGQDREGAPLVAIINETMARRFWPAGEAIGQRFKLGADEPAIEVVGVARDGKYRDLWEAPRPSFYIPVLQEYRPAMALHVRAAGDTQAMMAAVRREVQALDSNLPVFDVRTFAEQRDTSLRTERLAATLFSVFGLLALALAGIGVYGVMAYSVASRTREIGVRMALGAQGKDILRMVVGQGLVLSLGGVGLGVAGALALTHYLQSLLYGVSVTDPLTFAGVALLLIGVALLACYVPARRATKVDPMVALRYE